MDRCALFVDAGYLLADGAMAVHGTTSRESVSWDYPGVIQFLGNLARDRTGLPLLRCYWYEGTADGRRTPEHDALADLPGVKLRLARIRSGRRGGVETEIHRDLTTLARNRAVSDALVVSAEEDLAQVVEDVQDLGMRVTIVHITVGGNWTISRTLRQECDGILEIGEAHLRPYVELVIGSEPLRGGDRAYPARAVANGHGQVGILSHQPALPSGAHPAPPAIYTSPVIAEYQRVAQPLNGQPLPTPAGDQSPRGASAPPLGQTPPPHGQHHAQQGPQRQVGMAQGQQAASGQQAGQPQHAQGAGPQHAMPAQAPAQPGAQQHGLEPGPQQSSAPSHSPQQAQPQTAGHQVTSAVPQPMARSAGAGGPGMQPGPEHQAAHHAQPARMDQQAHYPSAPSAPGVPAHALQPQPNFQSQGAQLDHGQPTQPARAQPAGAGGQPGMQAGAPVMPPHTPGGSPLENAGHPGPATQPPGATVPPGMPHSAQQQPLQHSLPGSGGHSYPPPPGGPMPGVGQPRAGMQGQPQSGPPAAQAQAQAGIQGMQGQPMQPQPQLQGHHAAHSQPGLPGQQLPPGQPGIPGQPGPQAQTGPQHYPGVRDQQAPPGQPGVPGQPGPQAQTGPQHYPGVRDQQASPGQHVSQQMYAAPPPAPPGYRGPGDESTANQAPVGDRQPPQGSAAGPHMSAPAHAAMSSAAPHPQTAPRPYPGGAAQRFGAGGSDQRAEHYPGPQAPHAGGPGAAYVPAQGPYSGPQPAAHQAPVPPPVAVSLADAVQAAHREGFQFGQAVARDAPALWLEAVLARKPRMPSDLEARLLQDSALPIDSLLHDEVRHALRRGFWDALERPQ